MSLLIVKPVEHACNLRCKYCYYCQQEQGVKKERTMDFNVLNNLISKSIKYFEKRVDFVWHGGEPLLAGKNFFNEILKIERQERKNNLSQKIINGIQTNATLIDEDWVQFFSANNFNVGVSCDGPEKFHNHCRIYKNKTGSFSNFMSGLKLLKQHELKIGTVCVVTKKSVDFPEELAEFFYQNGFCSYHPKACYEFDNSGFLAPFAITPEEYTKFMIKTFEWWFKKDDPNFQVRNLQETVKGLMGGKPKLCEFTGNCAKLFTVNYNGDIGPCDSFPSDKYWFGNINKQTWQEILSDDPYQTFLTDLQKSRENCRSCEWSMICRGGCLRYSYDYASGNWHHNIFCESKKELFSYIKARLKLKG